jgi:hypothetical protein
MAKKSTDTLEKQRTDLQNQQGKLDPKMESPISYNPNKRQRAIRRQVYERFYLLQGDTRRKEAEDEWEIADKEFGLVTDEVDPNDWHSHLQLPDAFSAIQTQSQETVERKSRPHLQATEETDEPIQEFGNAVLTHNMNTTGYDYQAFLSKLNASSRGTSFRRDYWRTDKRIVKDPVGVNDDGTIKYEEKEIIDFDDDYTEWIPNEYVFVDEKAKHIDEAIDWIRREIINIDEFHRVYGQRPDFINTEYVIAGGDTGTTSTIFKLPQDLEAEDVEVLHYENRAIDAYWVVANNVTICDSPLQSKHKELSLAVDYQYRIPGQFWGIGIPRVLHHLSEERKTIRNLNIDRQKIIIAGAFLHNSNFDLDDEETTLEPGRFISVDTNGQPLNAAIQQVNMGDVPASYFRTEEILLEDIRRASGIDDRITVSNSATTATQAAIVKESTLKRINLISLTNEMDTVVRIGRIKWSNIQFYYGVPRMNSVVHENEERQEKVYRTISVEGKKFSIKKEDGKTKLEMEDVKGSSALNLKPELNRYLDKSFNVSVDSDIFTPISKAIDQTKKTEMFSLLLGNPETMALLDLNGATADVLKTNDISPETWLKTTTNSYDMEMLAESENMVMAAGQPLSGTEGATEEHTLVHLNYTKTVEYAELVPEIQQIIMDHILQEHDNNPATGSAADLLGGAVDPMSGGMMGPSAGQAAPFGLSPQTTEPQAQVADLQPTNFAQPE